MTSNTVLQSIQTAIPAPDPSARSLTVPEIDNYFVYCQQMLKAQLHCQYKPLLQLMDALCMLAKKQLPTRLFASNLFQLQQLKSQQLNYLADLIHALSPRAIIALADTFLYIFFDMLRSHLENYGPLKQQGYQTLLLEMTPCIENSIRVYIRELVSCIA